MNFQEENPQKKDPLEVRRRNMADYLAELIVQAAKGEISDEDFKRAIEAVKEDITRMREQGHENLPKDDAK